MMPMLIQKQIEIAARATTVWRFIGTEEGLRQWWGLAVTLEAKQGGRCEERIQWQGRPCHLCGQVTVYDPPHQLALFLRNADATAGGPAWTTITITLTEQTGQTLVTLVQAVDSLMDKPVIGQSGASQPLPAVFPVVGKLQQPQNFLNTGTTVVPFPSLTARSIAPVDNHWLTQQETQWQERLAILGRQVLGLLNTTEPQQGHG